MEAIQIIQGMTLTQIANLFCLVVLCVGLLSGRHPLGLVAMTTCVLLVLTQVLTIEEAFAGFANQTVVMLSCMYVLSSAFSRTPLMTKIRGLMGTLQGKTGFILVVGVFGVCFVLAQFLPSGVTVPLMVTFLASLGDTGGDVTPSRLMFPCMGIASFCLGSLPIGLGVGAQAQINAFYEGMITDPSQLCQFLDPALFMIIPSILCLLFCIFGYKILPRGGVVSSKDTGKSAIHTGGEPITGIGAKIVYFCFFGTVLCLVVFSMLGSDLAYIFPAVSVLILYFTKTMTLPDIKKSLTGTIVFMVAGVLIMSDAMAKTGLGDVVGELILTLIGKTASPYFALFVFGVSAIAMTTFMSNFGSLAVLTPLAVSTAISAGWNPLPFVLIVKQLAWCDILLPSASSAAATGHAAAGYKLGESLRFSIPFVLLAVGGCMLSTVLFFPIRS